MTARAGYRIKLSQIINNNRKKMVLTVRELAEKIGAELAGPGSGQISSVNTVESAGGDEVTFVTDDRHLDKLEQSEAGAVIIGRKIEGVCRAQLVVKNVNAALIAALGLFAPKLTVPKAGVHPAAVVSENAKVAKSSSIGANVYIAEGAEIGDDTIIAAGVNIGENSKIGRNCRLDSNVVVYHNCTIGNNVIIQANTTIGSTGFGYSFIDGAHKLIPHNGGVLIEDFVEIGANCCVDRAKFSNTIIGAGTKIDNLVQIAHNVIIGKCCLIVGQAGIGGSSELGDGVILAGQSGVVDNIKIGNGAVVAAGTGVMNDIAHGKKVYGWPAHNIKKAFREIALTRRLPKMAEQLKRLAKKVEELEVTKNDTK